MNRLDCIRLTLIGVMLATMLVAASAGGQTAAQWIDRINVQRANEELPPVYANAALDAVAQQFLDRLLQARCVCPASLVDDERLLSDVQAAIGTADQLLDVAIVAGYNATPEAALTTTVNDPAHTAAILGQRIERGGIAMATVEPNASWLAPPPGGGEQMIDLTGFTVVVIVLAGQP